VIEKKILGNKNNLDVFFVRIIYLMNPNFFYIKKHPKFECEICDFRCSKMGDMNRHLRTDKHIILTNPNNFTSKNIAREFVCECGKVYKHSSTLSSHRKKCLERQNINENEENKINNKDLILKLINENIEFKQIIIEQNQTIKELVTKVGHTTNNNTNSHNKTFNLQFFLNKQCKDALNITEFINSIKMSLSDLETTGRLGYAEGISKIIVNNLKSLDTCKRPIHCSDLKREILYIKDNDKWEKENEEKDKLTNAIKVIANENIKQINEWKKENPDCTESESRKNNVYLKIISNAMSGSTEDETNKNINKIISNVAKEVVIDK
jgi:hypothetical protein